MADGGAPSSAASPKLKFRLTVDRALAGCGVALAFLSMAFAGYMIADRGRQPYFPGLEYLAIFSKPSHGLRVAAHPAPPAAFARLDPPGDADGVDPTPTGSIASAARADPPDGAGLPPPRYRLVSATRAAAWVESEFGFRQIKPGEILSSFGRVAAIEQRSGRWALVADSGSILELSDAVSLSPARQDPDRRFARRMIFGPPQ